MPVLCASSGRLFSMGTLQCLNATQQQPPTFRAESFAGELTSCDPGSRLQRTMKSNCSQTWKSKNTSQQHNMIKSFFAPSWMTWAVFSILSIWNLSLSQLDLHN
ncbi:unnamed protein product [Sphagnum troendelagicum]|uniref:Uncharacterized protein n=1 Tax=Sphagnum troendelagicum TaxID=128251 RepID=A0ABP0TS87_9BRYO